MDGVEQSLHTRFCRSLGESSVVGIDREHLKDAQKGQRNETYCTFEYEYPMQNVLYKCGTDARSRYWHTYENRKFLVWAEFIALLHSTTYNDMRPYFSERK